ncbi:response regulator [[Clostridium] symbiosum]|uniref:response regulator n=1 Tax=Clostridium symbiosum TaxID=1512 RepID=UPI001D098CB4|nr:response regulator [[Clostridium] symbiosum]MCB6609223.1 response regulator [[Clostridium] symbiosum]MCB6933052.1 response regulator [[Clostridium] symbiosum]
MESMKTILAIDDNRDILYTLEQIFNFQGWRPLLAAGYEEAEKYIKKEKIDLILVDYHMPGVDGISAVKEIRKKLPKVPIIVLTIEEEEHIVSRFMNAGANDYSLKPVKAVDLISRIKVHLQYHEKSQYYESYDKGISKMTLQKIENQMKGITEFLDIDMLEDITQIKKKTLYRYLQYLVKEGRVEQQYSYGDMGRPRTLYRWI